MAVLSTSPSELMQQQPHVPAGVSDLSWEGFQTSANITVLQLRRPWHATLRLQLTGQPTDASLYGPSLSFLLPLRPLCCPSFSGGTSRQRRCRARGCTFSPSYSKDGLKPAVYCGNHRKFPMIRVAHGDKTCGHEG